MVLCIRRGAPHHPDFPLAIGLTMPDLDYDPDDNFANSFDAGSEADDEESIEALVWQLLLLINPGDEDMALQQFAAYHEALDRGGVRRGRTGVAAQGRDRLALGVLRRLERSAVVDRQPQRAGRALEPAHRLGRGGSDRRSSSTATDVPALKWRWHSTACASTAIRCGPGTRPVMRMPAGSRSAATTRRCGWWRRRWGSRCAPANDAF